MLLLRAHWQHVDYQAVFLVFFKVWKYLRNLIIILTAELFLSPLFYRLPVIVSTCISGIQLSSKTYVLVYTIDTD